MKSVNFTACESNVKTGGAVSKRVTLKCSSSLINYRFKSPLKVSNKINPKQLLTFWLKRKQEVRNPFFRDITLS